LFLIVLLASLVPFGISAQTYTPPAPDNMLTPVDPIGVPPPASSTGTNESISVSSGGLSVFVPALSLPQRGGWNLTLGYWNNSMGWTREVGMSDHVGCCLQASPYTFYDNYTYSVNMSRRGMLLPVNFNIPTLTASIEYVGDYYYNYCDPMATGCGFTTYAQNSTFCVTNWTFTDWTGAKHSFSNNADCNITTKRILYTYVTLQQKIVHIWHIRAMGQ
jgi:hypothetical protein